MTAPAAASSAHWSLHLETMLPPSPTRIKDPFEWKRKMPSGSKQIPNLKISYSPRKFVLDSKHLFSLE